MRKPLTCYVSLPLSHHLHHMNSGFGNPFSSPDTSELSVSTSLYFLFSTMATAVAYSPSWLILTLHSCALFPSSSITRTRGACDPCSFAGVGSMAISWNVMRRPRGEKAFCRASFAASLYCRALVYRHMYVDLNWKQNARYEIVSRLLVHVESYTKPLNRDCETYLPARNLTGFQIS